MGLYLFNPNIQMDWVKTYPNKVGILVIFWILGVFWSFLGFGGYFGHLLGFGGILVIFLVTGVF